MFAILKTGGKQYRVQSGDVLKVELLAANPGDTVQFNDVLMVGDILGAPLVSGAGVQATVLDHVKADKVITFVKRRRKHSSQRTRGHRQQLTVLRVTDILASGAADTGIAAALGARSAPRRPVAAEPDRYAKNASDQAEMKKRVQTGGAAEKPATEGVNVAVAEAAPAEKPKRARKAKADEAEAPVAKAGVRPGNLLDAAREGGADDLKLISGVGPVLEELLHKNGVYHFDQIAAWSADEIDYMNGQLDFPGRIEREEWVKQAAELAQGAGASKEA